ncbi:pyruvate dehydrogenase E2 component (dihydrolipoamide acetyltransferase) [Paragonimus westermani]|uniref:Dihydrolipoamide acetyltransferase component of pyruvate dehydrogenase complex n=1 Tax=Paragonimus westermani TaxID=34504 RepID=A0A5J4NBM4_9TREM|nr:pyruvate dehydrogenase E2 component (dihydrolipoamide acetyltransferase) [Paragonimus westermani]
MKTAGHPMFAVGDFSFIAYPSHTVIKLPNLSPTMETGTVVSWAKSEGDEVNEGDLLAEIETDKATMSFEASDTGFLAKILAPAGTKDIPVGTPLCVVVEDSASVSAFKDYAPTASDAQAPAPAKAKPQVTDAPKPISQPPSTTQPPLPAVPPTSAAISGPQPTVTGVSQRVFASPLARKLASEQGIDLSQLAATKSGTGLRGMFRSADLAQAPAPAKAKPQVTDAPKPISQPPSTTQPPLSAVPPTSAAISGPQPTATGVSQRVFASPLARKLASEQGIDLSQLAATKSGTGLRGMFRSSDLVGVTSGLSVSSVGAFKDVPVTDLRATMAKRLTDSQISVPHYYLTADIEMDEVLKMRESVNSTLSKRGTKDTNAIKITTNDIIIKAVAVSCLKVPECNSSWLDTSIRQYNTVDVNVAVSTPDGLITPIVYGAESKGGTFTVSNLGMFGISSFSAIISRPQACLLAIGNTQPQLLPDETTPNGYRTKHVMSVTLCCDHRVVDGAVGATWLAEFKATLENPTLMLI